MLSRQKVRGAFLISINHHPVFSTADAYSALENIQNEGVYETINLTIAPKKKLSIKDIQKAVNNYRLFAPTTKWDNTAAIAEDEEDTPSLDRQQLNAINVCNQTDISKADVKQHHYEIKSTRRRQIITCDNVKDKAKQTLAPTEDDMEITTPYLDTYTLRAISKIRHPDTWNNPQLDPSSLQIADISADEIERMINAIQSKETTQQEQQALGFYTRKKVKTLDTWDLWHQGETKQLNQFEDLQMFGKPVLIDKHKNIIILRPHWQYNVKQDGTRRARLCCNGSKYAALILHALTITYLLCVEHPIQRLFF